MKKKRSFPLVLVALVLFFQSLIGIPVHAADEFSVNANAGYAIDADSGKVFSTKTATLPKALLLSLKRSRHTSF